MLEVLYPLVVIFVAVPSIINGFRAGLTRRLNAFLGFSFGAVGARILAPRLEHYFHWVHSYSQSPEFNSLSSQLMCGVTLYAAIFSLIYILTSVLQNILCHIPVGILNRIAGSFFNLLKNLLWLSILLNLMLCLSSKSGLLQFEKAGDGNLMAAVMSMTHAILGCPGAEEFAHYHQLKEAKFISGVLPSPQNITPLNNVIEIGNI